jgi:hypothetical protein
LNQTRFKIHPKVQGGRTICESVVQEIKEDFLTHKSLDQVLILALGDNKLRPKSLKNGFSVDEVTKMPPRCHPIC